MLPVWPIVAALGAPVVEMVRDAPGPEDVGEPVGRAAVLVWPAPRREVDVALMEVGEEVGVAQVGHVVDGVVEVEVVVVVPVHEPAEVVHAGEGQASPDEVGVLQQGVRGMVGTEGRPGGRDGDALGPAVVVDEGHHFEGDVRVVRRLHVAAVAGVGPLVVPALVVDGVDAEDLHPAGVDVMGERADHALALIFIFVAAAGGEHEQGQAIVPVDSDPHLLPEPGRMPRVALLVHATSGRRIVPPGRPRRQAGGAYAGGRSGSRIVTQSVRVRSHSWMWRPWDSKSARIPARRQPAMSSSTGTRTLSASSLSTVRRAICEMCGASETAML